MKNSERDSRGIDATSNSRRKMLKAAAAGAGLSLLPGAQAFAALSATAKFAPSVGMGYVANGSSLLADGLSVSASRGNYELRVIGAGTQVPFALSAQYAGAAEHRFWQAWLEQGLLQRSSPITIRWAASAGNALTLNVQHSSGVVPIGVTAQPGTYILTVVPPIQRAPAWSTLMLREQSTGGVSMKLVSRATNAEVDFSYALFSVQRV